MEFKELVVGMCEKVLKDGTPLTIKLPRAPLSWTKDQLDQRFMQLLYLIQQNGCTLEKANITDYKIRPLNSKDDLLKPRKRR